MSTMDDKSAEAAYQQDLSAQVIPTTHLAAYGDDNQASAAIGQAQPTIMPHHVESTLVQPPFGVQPHVAVSEPFGGSSGLCFTGHGLASVPQWRPSFTEQGSSIMTTNLREEMQSNQQECGNMWLPSHSTSLGPSIMPSDNRGRLPDTNSGTGPAFSGSGPQRYEVANDAGFSMTGPGMMDAPGDTMLAHDLHVDKASSVRPSKRAKTSQKQEQKQDPPTPAVAPMPAAAMAAAALNATVATEVGKAYPCKECTESFPTAQARRKHIDTAHRTFICTYPGCMSRNKAFSRISSLNRHMQDIHGVEIQNTKKKPALAAIPSAPDPTHDELQAYLAGPGRKLPADTRAADRQRRFSMRRPEKISDADYIALLEAKNKQRTAEVLKLAEELKLQKAQAEAALDEAVEQKHREMGELRRQHAAEMLVMQRGDGNESMDVQEQVEALRAQLEAEFDADLKSAKHRHSQNERRLWNLLKQ